MEEHFKVGPFNIEVYLREIKIGRNGSWLTINPGQVPSAIDLVLNAMRIESFPLLPRRLDQSPFIVTFDANRNLGLKTEDLNSPSLPFDFELGDTLILALKSAQEKWIDVTKADGVREMVIPRAELPDPPIDRSL